MPDWSCDSAVKRRSGAGSATASSHRTPTPCARPSSRSRSRWSTDFRS